MRAKMMPEPLLDAADLTHRYPEGLDPDANEDLADYLMGREVADQFELDGADIDPDYGCEEE